MRHILNETDTRSIFEMPYSRVHSGDIIQLNKDDGSSIILHVHDGTFRPDPCSECVFNLTDDCPKFNVECTYPVTMGTGRSNFTVGPYYLCYSCHPSSHGYPCVFREVVDILEDL